MASLRRQRASKPRLFRRRHWGGVVFQFLNQPSLGGRQKVESNGYQRLVDGQDYRSLSAPKAYFVTVWGTIGLASFKLKINFISNFFAR